MCGQTLSTVLAKTSAAAAALSVFSAIYTLKGSLHWRFSLRLKRATLSFLMQDSFWVFTGCNFVEKQYDYF
jgi:hypothetical protein